MGRRQVVRKVTLYRIQWNTRKWKKWHYSQRDDNFWSAPDGFWLLQDGMNCNLADNSDLLRKYRNITAKKKTPLYDIQKRQHKRRHKDDLKKTTFKVFFFLDFFIFCFRLLCYSKVQRKIEKYLEWIMSCFFYRVSQKILHFSLNQVTKRD